MTMDGLLANVPTEKYNCDFNSNVPFYNLPPLLGYVGHDVTRPKAPAAKLCGRSRVIGSFEESPGPANYNARGMTRFGPADGIKAKVIGRPRDLSKEEVPGPGAYFPKSTLTIPSDPRPVLLGRPRALGSHDVSPGPANYSAEPALGYGLPRLPNSRAAVIKSRPREIGFYAESGPGPGKYTYDDKKFMRKSPAAPLGGRGAEPAINKDVPAPNSYHPKTNAFKKRAPAFSFGRRQSKCMTVVIEEDDNGHYLEHDCK
ncbi:Hypothetical protein NTJ_13016 [Nesidiocoris tenuis]|nr:Hypothetical protein NTJ_13016 [Nesidiocoris tenuis]